MASFDESPSDSRDPDQTVSGGGMPAINLDLIYFILFRNKWKIIICTLAGFVAAAIALKTLQPPFSSSAKLFIKYVEETPPASADSEARLLSPNQSGTVILTELEILTSFDLARDVALAIGPEKILGPENKLLEDPATAAAGVVYGGLTVEVPNSGSVLAVQFEHSDPGLTQPILSQIIASYLKRHAAIHHPQADFDEGLVQETDQRRARLKETEDELRRVLEQAGVIDLESAKKVFAERIARIQEDLLASEAALAERRAEITSLTGGKAAVEPPPGTDGLEAGTGAEPPAEQMSAYRQVTTLLNALYAQEQDLLTRFTPTTPMVTGVRARISEQERTKARLESQYPQFLSRPGLTAAAPTTSRSETSTFDLGTALGRLSALEARRKTLEEQLARVQTNSARLNSLETTITELQRKRELQEQHYRYLTATLERSRVDSALGPGRVSNISVVQAPSPPLRDDKKLKKIVLGLAVVGLGFGLALSLAIELFLDQSLKRPADIDSSLGIPLILSMPRLSPAQLQSSSTAVRGLLKPRSGNDRPDGPDTQVAKLTGAESLAPWTPGHGLHDYFDALRNQLVHSFEMRNITRKPKLVAVTSAGSDAGVSTVAAGLAASLSKTGDGNVLLVDMNPDRKAPKFFQKGDLKVGLGAVLAQETRDDALVSENLYVVSESDSEDRLSWVIPKRFAALVPRMKASDYDYIIFDMPPVNQISATPQLARFMDQVLLVVESEKTHREVAKKAAAALTEAGANVAVVLNKTRDVVPRMLAPQA